MQQRVGWGVGVGGCTLRCGSWSGLTLQGRSAGAALLCCLLALRLSAELFMRVCVTQVLATTPVITVPGAADGALAQPVLAQLLRLRAEMSHFATNLQYYIQFEVMEACWQVGRGGRGERRGGEGREWGCSAFRRVHVPLVQQPV